MTKETNKPLSEDAIIIALYHMSYLAEGTKVHAAACAMQALIEESYNHLLPESDEELCKEAVSSLLSVLRHELLKPAI